jgi:hypothetical protein
MIHSSQTSHMEHVEKLYIKQKTLFIYDGRGRYFFCKMEEKELNFKISTVLFFYQKELNFTNIYDQATSAKKFQNPPVIKRQK